MTDHRNEQKQSARAWPAERPSAVAPGLQTRMTWEQFGCSPETLMAVVRVVADALGLNVTTQLRDADENEINVDGVLYRYAHIRRINYGWLAGYDIVVDPTLRYGHGRLVLSNVLAISPELDRLLHMRINGKVRSLVTDDGTEHFRVAASVVLPHCRSGLRILIRSDFHDCSHAEWLHALGRPMTVNSLIERDALRERCRTRRELVSEAA